MARSIALEGQGATGERSAEEGKKFKIVSMIRLCFSFFLPDLPSEDPAWCAAAGPSALEGVAGEGVGDPSRYLIVPHVKCLQRTLLD